MLCVIHSRSCLIFVLNTFWANWNQVTIINLNWYSNFLFNRSSWSIRVEFAWLFQLWKYFIILQLFRRRSFPGSLSSLGSLVKIFGFHLLRYTFRIKGLVFRHSILWTYNLIGTPNSNFFYLFLNHRRNLFFRHVDWLLNRLISNVIKVNVRNVTTTICNNIISTWFTLLLRIKSFDGSHVDVFTHNCDTR